MIEGSRGPTQLPSSLYTRRRNSSPRREGWAYDRRLHPGNEPCELCEDRFAVQPQELWPKSGPIPTTACAARRGQDRNTTTALATRMQWREGGARAGEVLKEALFRARGIAHTSAGVLGSTGGTAEDRSCASGKRILACHAQTYEHGRAGTDAGWSPRVRIRRGRVTLATRGRGASDVPAQYSARILGWLPSRARSTVRHESVQASL